MDPFTLALATFGVQKLRGKSTKRSLRDAFIVGGGAYGIGKIAPSGIGSMFQGAPLSSLGFGAPATEAVNTAGSLSEVAPTKKNFLQRIIGSKAQDPKVTEVLLEKAKNKDEMIEIIKNAKGSGYQNLGAGEKIALASTAIPLVSAAFDDSEEPKPPFTEEDYKKAYAEQSGKLEGAFTPATQNPNYNPFPNASTFYAAEGGIANIKKFNEGGGVQYLPSKIVKDEKDYSLYERAGGYIEDETGMGNKDKDTMLAQLADGEFVSRADAILGAGIMSGASPSDFKDMRAKGAKFFYNQQSQLKRIYELTDGAKQTKN